jgi:hypothetical protein
LRTKNRGLNSALIADTMETAKPLDQSILHPVDFRYREVLPHLLGETLQQITVAGHRLLEGIHNRGANQMLGRNHIVQVELKRLFENMPLGLPILPRNRNELIVELGVDLRRELLGRGWHGFRFLVRFLSYLFTLTNQYKSLFIHIVDNKRYNMPYQLALENPFKAFSSVLNGWQISRMALHRVARAASVISPERRSF